ncbi:MAG: exodeoxyribonuclease V subunit alpha [Desulfobulbaceae bacterium]|nr:exodeoxyribonuclease V subunit alpha [Desulfobulbaceae bacterium]
MTVLDLGGEPVILAGLDRYFGRFISRFSGDCRHAFWGAALVSMATRDGHSCLELREWAGRGALLGEGLQPLLIPLLSEWCEGLSASPAVGDGDDCTPLVLAGERLYLARYWGYEKSVAEWLGARGGESPLSCEETLLIAGLSRWFPPNSGGDDGNQRLAALVCLLRPLAIITGGPGTGKTTTVALILALLAEQYRGRGERFRVALAAPTGKAAMRLQESIARIKAAKNLPDEVAEVIPDQVLTVHRLLGPVGGSPDFRHDVKNPLPVELVVVDEVSMVDLPLMAKLLRALPAGARLILLGDRHQLSSVEPGSVLGDLCRPEALPNFSQEMATVLGKFGVTVKPAMVVCSAVGLADSLVELSRSHRFDAASGIGRLGAMVRQGDRDGAWEILTDMRARDVLWREVSSSEQLDELLSELVTQGVFAGLAAPDPGTALSCGEGFQVLCALRRGPFGADHVNEALERILVGRDARVAAGRHYQGRPVMVLRNDYDLGLYNGDVGVVMSDTDRAGELKVFFPAPGGLFRKVAPARLPPHQTAYAMTVHKSQGSEFDRVVLLLPDRPAPVLSRELLFTAITRAKRQVEIWGGRQVLAQTIGTVSERRSGLRDKLWADKSGSPRR